jgi:hypothetical protein
MLRKFINALLLNGYFTFRNITAIFWCTRFAWKLCIAVAKNWHIAQGLTGFPRVPLPPTKNPDTFASGFLKIDLERFTSSSARRGFRRAALLKWKLLVVVLVVQPSSSGSRT